MNIQISVVIWTVICFGLFILIINKLLFKPLLKVMDARREKIESAHAKAEEIKTAREAKLAQIAAKKEESAKLRSEQIKNEREALKQNFESEIKELYSEKEQKLESMKNENDTANSALDREISASIDDMVNAFAEKLVS